MVIIIWCKGLNKLFLFLIFQLLCYKLCMVKLLCHVIFVFSNISVIYNIKYVLCALYV